MANRHGQLLGALAGAERAAGLTTRQPDAKRMVLCFGNTGVAATHFRHPWGTWQDRGFWSQYRRVLHASPQRLVTSLKPFKAHWTEARADVVLFKTHVRGFYCDNSLSIKMANPARRRSRQRLQNEIRIRGALPQCSSVLVPQLINRKQDADVDYLLEEIVTDSRPVDIAQEPKLVVNALFDFYVEAGLTTKPLQSVIRPDAAFGELERNAENFGFTVPDIAKSFFQNNFTNPDITNQLVLCGICHGDLTPTNLRLQGPKLVILDWEHGHNGLIFMDISRLCLENPDIQHPFLDAIGGWARMSAQPLLDPKLQLFLGVIAALNRRLERFPDYRNERRRKKRLKAYNRKAQKYISFLTALAEDGAKRDS